jgi:hypothetical protein
MSRFPRLSLLLSLAVVLAFAAAGPAPAATDTDAANAICASVDPGVQCGPGNNRQTAGGGEKVPHTGWPAVSGVLWKVLDSDSHAVVGGPDNDELLGHHGSDTLSGAGGNDILWGDWDPSNNNTRQRDVLRGGAGNDLIYPSHGPTRVDAGAGNDFIWAFYGKGTINCGAGNDTARVRENGAFKLKGCEHVLHFCQFGSTSDGSCKKPGERLALAARLRSLPVGARF